MVLMIPHHSPPLICLRPSINKKTHFNSNRHRIHLGIKMKEFILFIKYMSTEIKIRSKSRKEEVITALWITGFRGEAKILSTEHFGGRWNNREGESKLLKRKLNFDLLDGYDCTWLDQIQFKNWKSNFLKDRGAKGLPNTRKEFLLFDVLTMLWATRASPDWKLELSQQACA